MDNFVVYVEDAPTNECTASSGLSKAFTPTLNAIDSVNNTYVFCQSNGFYSKEKVLSFDSNVIFTGRVVNILLKTISKLMFPVAWAVSFWFGYFLAMRVLRSNTSVSKNTRLFGVIGVNIYSISRFMGIQRRLKRSGEGSIRKSVYGDWPMRLKRVTC